jgi:hypothetical protein
VARIDRDPPEPKSPYANEGEVSATDAAALESPTGRLTPVEEAESPAQEVQDDEIREKSVGTRPASDETNFHLSGTGAIETEDGLDEVEEELRSTVEDIPDEAAADTPVFDRAEEG